MEEDKGHNKKYLSPYFNLRILTLIQNSEIKDGVLTLIFEFWVWRILTFFSEFMTLISLP